ncbi:MAG: hypothetical protein H2057_06890 [Alphaproteobacteria bacterium]|nr:hypothetical protein [Alphaproteobacteria bacterium]
MTCAQLILPLETETSYAPEAFFVADHNRNAHDVLQKVTHNPVKTLYIWGEKACGKTHLAHMFSFHAGAHFLSPKDIVLQDFWEKVTAHPAFILENIETLQNEASLFHLLNSVKEGGKSLLLTSRNAPSDLPFTLPDLCSRLRGLEAYEIQSPDDLSASAFVYKRFSDFSMKASPLLVTYLLTHSARSYAALDKVITSFWQVSLKEKRRPTIQLLKEVLEQTPPLTA